MAAQIGLRLTRPLPATEPAGDAPTPADPLLNALRFHVDRRMPSAIGFGRDRYAYAPVHHPMAYAMYARGFVNLHRLTGESGYLTSAASALTRLEHLRSPRTGPCWGLGFRWRERPAEHPFTITTAICGSAFLEVALATGDTAALATAHATANWLAHEIPWAIRTGGASPWFSPDLPYSLPNVASTTAGLLAGVAVATGDATLFPAARAAAGFVLASRHPGGFWRYGYGGTESRGSLRPKNIVDAIHTSYVLDGLTALLKAAPAWLERPAVCTSVRCGTHFFLDAFIARDGRCREKVVVVDRDDPLASELLARPALRAIAVDRDVTLAAFPAESRLWGYGAALGMFARAGAHGLVDPGGMWPTIHRLYTVHMTPTSGRFRYLPNELGPYPRHEAHLFEGLSAFLEQQASSAERW